MAQHSYHSALNRYYQDGIDVDEIPARLFDDHTKAQLRDLLTPLLTWYMRHALKRPATKRAERRWFAPTDDSPLGPPEVTLPASGADKKTVPAELRDLCAKEFALPDGRWVKWGNATVEEHEAVADWCESRAGELLQLGDRHRWAAKEIREHGTTCLGDILKKAG